MEQTAMNHYDYLSRRINRRFVTRMLAGIALAVSLVIAALVI
jgi:hypothetical protein